MAEEKKKMESGTHKTKVNSWGVRETANGKVQMWIKFENGAYLFQMLGVSDVGNRIAAETLTILGYKGKDINASFFKKDALDKDREIEIYVKNTPNEETGEIQTEVRVNNPNRGMKGDLDKDAGIEMLKKLKITLKSDLKKASEEIDITAVEEEESTSEKSNSDDDDDDDEIPF